LEAHPGFEVISRDAASDSEDDHDDDYLQRRLPEPKEDEYEGTYYYFMHMLIFIKLLIVFGKFYRL
jgi:hypothetical protein